MSFGLHFNFEDFEVVALEVPHHLHQRVSRKTLHLGAICFAPWSGRPPRERTSRLAFWSYVGGGLGWWWKRFGYLLLLLLLSSSRNDRNYMYRNYLFCFWLIGFVSGSISVNEYMPGAVANSYMAVFVAVPNSRAFLRKAIRPCQLSSSPCSSGCRWSDHSDPKTFRGRVLAPSVYPKCTLRLWFGRGDDFLVKSTHVLHVYFLSLSLFQWE